VSAESTIPAEALAELLNSFTAATGVYTAASYGGGRLLVAGAGMAEACAAFGGALLSGGGAGAPTALLESAARGSEAVIGRCTDGRRVIAAQAAPRAAGVPPLVVICGPVELDEEPPPETTALPCARCTAAGDGLAIVSLRRLRALLAHLRLALPTELARPAPAASQTVSGLRY